MRYGKIDHANNPCTSQHSGCSLNPVKKDFWLPSGFWWPKDGRHQKFIKFLYLFKNNRPNEPLRKRRLTFAIRRTSWEGCRCHNEYGCRATTVRFLFKSNETLQKYLRYLKIFYFASTLQSKGIDFCKKLVSLAQISFLSYLLLEKINDGILSMISKRSIIFNCSDSPKW